MADISEEQAELSVMFGAKKKKKTTTKKSADATATEGENTAEATASAEVASSSAAAVSAEPEKPVEAVFRCYDYEFLLNRVMTLVQQNNPELVEKSRTKIPPPNVQRCKGLDYF